MNDEIIQQRSCCNLGEKIKIFHEEFGLLAVTKWKGKDKGGFFFVTGRK